MGLACHRLSLLIEILTVVVSLLALLMGCYLDILHLLLKLLSEC